MDSIIKRISSSPRLHSSWKRWRQTYNSNNNETVYQHSITMLINEIILNYTKEKKMGWVCVPASQNPYPIYDLTKNLIPYL